MSQHFAMQRSRGTSLVEALVALLVMALGMLGTLGLQAHLRGHADDSRQRLFALQLAQQSLDAAQANWGRQGPAALVDEIVSVERDGARFEVQREVSPLRTAGWRVQVHVTWSGRQQAEHVTLHGVLAAGDPALWVALAEGPADGQTQFNGHGGHAGIPPEGIALGPHHRFVRPSPQARWGWRIDARSGRITHTCQLEGDPDLARLSAADSGLCTPQAQPSVLLSGHVRAALSGESDDTSDPVPELGVQLTLSSSPHLSPPVCVVQARGTVTDYHCAVLLRSPTEQDPTAYWSGRTDLVGLPLGSGAYRVCRYSGDRNGNAQIDNDEHPAQYQRVQQSMRHQHFLVLHFETPCPTGVLPRGSELRHTSTQQHQP